MRLQRHPAKQLVLHVDLQRVRDDVEMTVVLPIHFLNEETAHGVKMEGGQVIRNAVDIEITCLPGVLPSYIEVDLADLKLGDSLHLSNITLPEGVVSTQLSQGEDHDCWVLVICDQFVAEIKNISNEKHQMNQKNLRSGMLTMVEIVVPTS